MRYRVERKRWSGVDAGGAYLGGIDPGNDANHGEEHAEHEIHGDHGAESVVVWVWVVAKNVVLG